jgi:GNAT superfamily N-acetyltransferase
MAFSADVLELAESLNTALPREEGTERILDERYAISLRGVPHPSFNVVQRLRLADDAVEATVTEVRALLAARGVRAATWEVGPSARPHDLVGRLQALGMRPAEEPLAVGMALTGPPAGTAGDAVVRRVETLDEYLAAAAIAAAGFGMDTESAAAQRATAPERFAREQANDTRATYLAFVEGEPVAFATAIFTDAGVVLGGGATLEHARGRGAYRALVDARAQDGRARGLDILVTQAGAMSRPILQRLGFTAVCDVRILLDEFG